MAGWGKCSSTLESHDFAENEVFFLEVKYERVPRFCSYCGFLGHGQRDCKLPVDLQNMRFSATLGASYFKHSGGRDSYAAPGSSNARRFLHFDSEAGCGLRVTLTRRVREKGGGTPEEILMDPMVQAAIATVSTIKLGPGSNSEEEAAPKLGQGEEGSYTNKTLPASDPIAVRGPSLSVPPSFGPSPQFREALAETRHHP
ncbi:hypothetical protein D1007_19952 [Hordeum vulgare]|nr:hypothetical protein D1007_19952 [Hordeum vulgare]